MQKINIILQDQFLTKILKNFPKNKKYLLTICATQSKERFKIIKKFLKLNNTKYLLLEKFCFINRYEFEEFNLKLKNNTKSFINSWSYIVARKIRLINKLKNFTLKCNIEEGSLLASISHILHIFNYLSKKQKILKFHKSKYEIIKSTTRKFYNELTGTIKLEDYKKNILIINTKKKSKNPYEFFIEQQHPKIDYRIFLTKNREIKFYSSSKKIMKIAFPFSTYTSHIFLKKCMEKKFNYMPSFEDDYPLSTAFLDQFKVKIP